MSDIRGIHKVTVGGKEYKLFLGMSVLAELQSEHGQDVLERLEPPQGAGKNWLPDLNIIHSILLFSLQRYHEEEATRWTADDILAENPDILPDLLSAAFPQQKEAVGNGKKPKKAA